MPIAKDHPLRRRIDAARMTRMPWYDDVQTILDGIDERTSYRMSELLDMVGKDTPDQAFAAATAVLSSWPDAIFEARLYMTGAHGDADLDPGDYGKVLQGEPVVHPDTGEMVMDPKDHTFVRYDPRAAEPDAAPEV